jgi:hypothetical protein
MISFIQGHKLTACLFLLTLNCYISAPSVLQVVLSTAQLIKDVVGTMVSGV